MTHRRATARGAALLEFNLAAILALLPLLLGILQFALLGSAYHLLGFATAEAARAGSVGHARSDAMYSALAAGLVGLHADLGRLGSARAGEAAVELASGRLKSEAEVRAFGAIERLSPSSGDFQDFARLRDGRNGIPNDSLEYRPSTPGARSGHSIQEANWLHIRVRYCHVLVVPFIDRLLPAILKRLDDDAANQRCYAAGRVPLRVTGSAPMQSEAWP